MSRSIPKPPGASQTDANAQRSSATPAAAPAAAAPAAAPDLPTLNSHLSTAAATRPPDPSTFNIQPSTAAATPTPTQPLKKQLRILAAAFGGAVAAALAGYFCLRAPSAPSEDEIRQFASTLVTDDRLRLVNTASHVITTRRGQTQIVLDLSFETKAPVFASVDAASWLRNELRFEAADVERRSHAVGPRARELAGAAPASLGDVTLLTLVAPAGAPATYQAMVDASRSGSTWSLHQRHGAFTHPAPSGSLRPIAGASFVVNDPKDLAELKRLVVANEAYLKRLEDGQRQALAEIQQQRARTFATLQPGQVFATAPDSHGARLSLEIMQTDPTKETLSVRLRNNEGWTHTRWFDGRVAEPADDPAHATEVVLRLRSTEQDAQAVGGAPLTDPGTLGLTVVVDGRTLTGQWATGQEFKATALSSTELAELQTALESADRRKAEGEKRQALMTSAGGRTTDAGRQTTADRRGKTDAGVRTTDGGGQATASAAAAKASGGKTGGVTGRTTDGGGQTAGRGGDTAAPGGTDPRAAAQAAGKMVRTVRDVKSAVQGGGSLFDRALAGASAVLSAVPKPKGQSDSRTVEPSAGSSDGGVPKTDDAGQTTQEGSQRTEDGGQTTDGRGPTTDDSTTAPVADDR